MALNQDISQQLKEANDTIDYFGAELEESEEKLKNVQHELAEAKGELENTRCALEAEEETCERLSLELNKSKQIASAERKKHEKAMAALRHAHEEQSLRVTSEKDLEFAKATIKDLGFQLDKLRKQIREKDGVVSDLARARDEARCDFETAVAATAFQLETKITNMSGDLSDITAKYEGALAELSATEALLRAETAAKEQAQGAAQEFQGKFTSVETMIDDAINRVGCADNFVHRSKLIYIPESADAVLTLLAEREKSHRALRDERKTKQESGATAPDVQGSVDPVVGMSDDLEAELRAHNQQQRAEIQRQAVEAVNLKSDLKKRDQQIRALEKQLASEQSRATELQELGSQSALFSRKLDLATSKIAKRELMMERRALSLAKVRSEKESDEKLLAETEKKLQEAKEQSMFRRIANRIYTLRIDKDTEIISSQTATLESLRGEISDLKDQIRQTELRCKKLLALQKPLPDPQATPRQIARLRLRAQFVVEQTVRDQMGARIRKELEDAFSEEKRGLLKAELAREFAGMQRESQDKAARVSGTFDDSSRATVVKESGISPVQVSLSGAGVETPTVAATPSTTGMRIIAIFAVVVLFVVAAALLWPPAAVRDFNLKT
jgi:hypothetical protein